MQLKGFLFKQLLNNLITLEKEIDSRKGFFKIIAFDNQLEQLNGLF